MMPINATVFVELSVDCRLELLYTLHLFACYKTFPINNSNLKQLYTIRTFLVGKKRGKQRLKRAVGGSMFSVSGRS
jgi:hypothetical protein